MPTTFPRLRKEGGGASPADRTQTSGNATSLVFHYVIKLPSKPMKQAVHPSLTKRVISPFCRHEEAEAKHSGWGSVPAGLCTPSPRV